MFGLVFSDQIETGARNLWVIAIALIALALVLVAAEKVGKRDRVEEEINTTDAVVVGTAQALALIPGASRSGTTITAGLFRGLTREAAARFSFLLSIPAVVLSGAVRGPQDRRQDRPGRRPHRRGAVFAFVVGLASIPWLMRWLANHSTFIFIYYRIALGVLLIVLLVDRRHQRDDVDVHAAAGPARADRDDRPGAGRPHARRAPRRARPEAGRRRRRSASPRCRWPRSSPARSTAASRPPRSIRRRAGRRAASWQVDDRLIECDYGDWTGKPLKDLAKDPLWKVVQTQPSAARFPDGESLAEMLGPRGRRGARLGRPPRRRRDLGRLQPRRRDQGDPGRRARPAPGPVPAHRRRPVLGVGRPLHRRPAVRAALQRHRRRPGRVRPAQEDAARARRATPRSAAARAAARSDAARATRRLDCIMPRQFFLFDRPSRFVAGTVGEPGERTFFLQATDGAARRLGGAGEAAGRGAGRPARAAARRGRRPHRHRAAGRPTPTPTRSSSRSTRSSASRDGAGLGRRRRPGRDRGAGAGRGRRRSPRRRCSRTSRTGPDALRVRIEPTRARAFVERARRVIAAGRPPCPLCGQPLDPAGHVCPRHNGYHRDVTLEPVTTGRLTPSCTRRRRSTDAGATTRSRCSSAARSRSRAGSSTRPTPRSTARSPPTASPRPASTSRSRGSGRCGTSPTARWPSARSPPTRCRPRPAGTSCRRPSTATGRPGPGMVQLWIAEDDDGRHRARCMRRRDRDALRRIAVFDAVINNADRKGGHLLPTPAGHVYGVDHGVTFHVEDKLRTVLWQWAGATLPDDAQDVLRRLRRDLDGALGEQLGELLTTARGAPHPGAGRPAARRPAGTPSRAATGRPCPGRRCSSGAAAQSGQLGQALEGRRDALAVAARKADQRAGRAGSWPAGRPTAR